MLHLPESRVTAFAVHLLLSATIFTGLSLFCYFILLPGFLFYSEGGFTILRLIGGVDVVLGPLVTLIIYNKNKPEIKMDLAIIATIQIAALLYGLHSLWSVRPIAVFYAKGEYHVAYESTFEDPAYSDISGIKALNHLKPPTIAISLPEKFSSLKQAVYDSLITTGKSYFANESRYRDYKDQLPDLSKYGLSIDQAVREGIIAKDSPLLTYAKGPYRVYRFESDLKPGFMVLNTENGNFVHIAK